MVVTKKWVLAKQYEGDPTNSNLRLEESLIQDENSLQDGEVLCEAVFLSVDPYMRLFPLEVGSVMPGEQISRVVATRNPDFPVNTYWRGQLGWQTHTVVTDCTNLSPLPPLGDLSMSLSLGVLGLTGMTAYFGLLDICDPKPGETVLVTAAAGAVGSIVGQIAKIKGCKVIGFCGSQEKCEWLKGELGFDEVFNYKTVSVDKALKTAAPDGVDCFFDNIGGAFTTQTLTHMKTGGRVVICGSISTYKFGKDQPSGPYPYITILLKQLRIQGVYGLSYQDQWPQAQEQMVKWIQEGKVKYKETVTTGFENMDKAFFDLFNGANIGKAVVKV